MQYIKILDYRSISHQIYIAGVELNSGHNDGYTSWDVKQDLYRLKWLLNEILEDSPKFLGEEEFLDEHSKTKMWRTLKK